MKVKTINCIDYFAGIGAWEVASQIVNEVSGSSLFNTIQFVEIDPHAQQVLRSHFPNIPIHSDVKTYTPTPGTADVHFTSFPCTNTSSAGKQTGLAGSESGLWFESLRCICIGRPRFVVVEQPEGIINRGLRAILGGLKLAGYQTEVELISAAELGAPHRRNRVFVIAHANDAALEQRQGWRCWSESVRADIKAVREIGARSQAQPGSMRVDDGVRGYLGGIGFSGWWRHNPPPVSPGLKGLSRKEAGTRRQCINLYGRSICPLQAAIALMRLKFLISLS